MKPDIALYEVTFEEHILIQTYLLLSEKDIKNGIARRELISDIKDQLDELADECSDLEFQRINPKEALEIIRKEGTEEVIVGDDVAKNFKDGNFVKIFENVIEETKKEEIRAELDRKQLKLGF